VLDAVDTNGLVRLGTAVRVGNAIARSHDASGESPQPAADARHSAGDTSVYAPALLSLVRGLDLLYDGCLRYSNI